VCKELRVQVLHRHRVRKELKAHLYKAHRDQLVHKVCRALLERRAHKALPFKERKAQLERRALTAHKDHLARKVLKELLAHKDCKGLKEH
jgi:hypothetical protein